jgi:endogenous inhibitor of DNA gyrase (YacG/DUF329 family)
MVKAKCDTCGKTISIKPYKYKKFKYHFCDKVCFLQWQRENTPKGKNSPQHKEKVMVSCEYCGKKFEKYPAWAKRTKMHFCSKKCLYNWKREHPKRGSDSPCWNSELVSCDFCGKEIYLPKHRLVSEKNFCSKKCYFAWIRANPPVGKKNPNWNRIKIKCDFCGKDIYKKPSRVNSHNALFCSKRCYDNWQIENTLRGKDNTRWNRIKVECSYCGKIIEKTPYRLKRYKNQFCDVKCFKRWKKENSSGEINPNWNGGKFPYYGQDWLKQRRLALERDRYKSVISGEYANIVHHIMPLKKYIEHAFDLFLYHIPYISYSTFNLLPYDLFIPDAFFEEANRLSNLVVVSSEEHPKIEGKAIEDIINVA